MICVFYAASFLSKKDREICLNFRRQRTLTPEGHYNLRCSDKDYIGPGRVTCSVDRAHTIVEVEGARYVLAEGGYIGADVGRDWVGEELRGRALDLEAGLVVGIIRPVQSNPILEEVSSDPDRCACQIRWCSRGRRERYGDIDGV
jgi:hypothetical protein